MLTALLWCATWLLAGIPVDAVQGERAAPLFDGRTFAGWEGDTATFKVFINPLINLVWWGGLILIFGTIISVGPSETLPAHVRQRALTTRRAGAVA